MPRTGIVSPFTGSIPRHREYHRSTYANVARIHDEYEIKMTQETQAHPRKIPMRRSDLGSDAADPPQFLSGS